MVRKQVYLEAELDRKVKRLARRRHCTESEVIRQAIAQVPDPDGDHIEKLRAAGLLLEVKGIEPMEPAELEALEKSIDEWSRAHGKPIGLTKAVLDERNESPW
jgi:hypothetical protein